jgi:hypothetical protein
LLLVASRQTGTLCIDYVYWPKLCVLLCLIETEDVSHVCL